LAKAACVSLSLGRKRKELNRNEVDADRKNEDTPATLRRKDLKDKESNAHSADTFNISGRHDKNAGKRLEIISS